MTYPRGNRVCEPRFNSDGDGQKDVLFTFDKRGLLGLLTGKKALLILAKGIDYEPGIGHARLGFANALLTSMAAIKRYLRHHGDRGRKELVRRGRRSRLARCGQGKRDCGRKAFLTT